MKYIWLMLVVSFSLIGCTITDNTLPVIYEGDVLNETVPRETINTTSENIIINETNITNEVNITNNITVNLNITEFCNETNCTYNINETLNNTIEVNTT